jgi:hypothetical protein
MPDIFTAILLLLVALYLHEKSGFLRNEVVYPILIFGVIAIHNSHFLIIAVLSVLLITGALLKKNYTVVRKALTMLTLAIGFFFLMCNMNLNYGNKFTFSKGSHVFMITKFAETGILKAYLDDNCEKKHLKLCNFKDNIHPVSWIFLWDDNSPLTVTGGWDANEREDKEIINDVFTTPKYATLFAQKSLIYTAKQLFTVGVPDITTIQGTNSMPYRMIAANFSDETGEYITAKQNSTGFHGDTCNIVYIFFFAVTSLIVLSFSGIMVSPGIRRIYSFVLIYLVVNAFVSATFSTVLPRYQCRVFWLLPATNIIVIARHLYYKMAGKVIGESKVI